MKEIERDGAQGIVRGDTPKYVQEGAQKSMMNDMPKYAQDGAQKSMMNDMPEYAQDNSHQPMPNNTSEKMSSALYVEHLTVKRKEFQLHDISFTLPKGYVMGLVGRNGAGKTTLIKAILGIVKGQDGVITCEGARVNPANIGLVMEESQQFRGLTIEENAALFSTLYPTFNHLLLKEYLARYGFTDEKELKEKPLLEYSKGQQVRYQLAFAMALQPKLLVLDEPTANLDPATRLTLLDNIQEIVESGEVSVLLCTHLTEDLDRIGDYITILDEGKMLLSMSKEEMLNEFDQKTVAQVICELAGDDKKRDDRKIDDRKLDTQEFDDRKQDAKKLNDRKLDAKKNNNSKIVDGRLNTKKSDDSKIDDGRMDAKKLDDRKNDNRKIDHKKIGIQTQYESVSNRTIRTLKDTESQSRPTHHLSSSTSATSRNLEYSQLINTIFQKNSYGRWFPLIMATYIIVVLCIDILSGIKGNHFATFTITGEGMTDVAFSTGYLFWGMVLVVEWKLAQWFYRYHSRIKGQSIYESIFYYPVKRAQVKKEVMISCRNYMFLMTVTHLSIKVIKWIICMVRDQRFDYGYEILIFVVIYFVAALFAMKELYDINKVKA